MKNVGLKTLAHRHILSLRGYEPGRPIADVARELGREGVFCIDKLASNENALGPSPLAVQAMSDAVHRMHQYPDGGASQLKRVAAAQIDIDPLNLLFTNGSNEAIELLGHVFLSCQNGMVMSDRAFLIYRLVAELFDAPVVSVPMRGFTHDLDAMLEAIQPETRLVFIANPNNPTGTMVDEAEIDCFMDRIPNHVVVVIDEAYIELVSPDLQPNTLQYVREERPVYLLRTFSKAYGLAGLRIGYVISTQEGIGLLERVRQPFNANAMAQAAAEAALGDDRFLHQTRTLTRQGLHYLGEQLDAMDIEYVPSVTNFVLLKIGNGRDAFHRLQRKGVIVRPMDGYGMPDHVRVTVGTSEQNERFILALQELLEARPERG